MLIILCVAFIVAAAVAVLSSKNCTMNAKCSGFLSQIVFFSETQAFGGTQRIYLFCLIVPTGYVSKCKKVANNCFVFVISFCVFRILEMLTTGHHR